MCVGKVKTSTTKPLVLWDLKSIGKTDDWPSSIGRWLNMKLGEAHYNGRRAREHDSQKRYQGKLPE